MSTLPFSQRSTAVDGAGSSSDPSTPSGYEAGYDFTTLVDRTAMGSSKWLGMHRTARENHDGADARPGIAPFSVADLDMPNAPEIVTGLQDALSTRVLGYTAPTPEYLASVSGWMRRRHDWQVPTEWICHSPGIVPAFNLAIRELSAPGDRIILQTPAYYPFFGAIENSGRELVRNPLVERDGRFGLDLDQLEEQARDPRATMLLLCSPHNPTGRVWDRDELEAIGRIVVDNDLLLISDEIHFDIVQPGVRHRPIASLSEEIAARTVTLTAPSKSFNLAGLGLGNVIISDPGLRERFTSARDALGLDNPNNLGMIACQLAYDRAEPWLDAMIDLIGRNHQVLTDFFARHFPQVRVAPLEATFLAWVDLRGLGLSGERLHEVLMAADLYLDEGTVFGPEGEGFERIVIATPTHVLEEALERLREPLAAAIG
jgi:cystathionine beta-lyase